MELLRPMLAAPLDLKKVVYPLLASPKIDGVRMLCNRGKTCTRSMKSIPNKFLQKLFSDPSLHGLDGELTIGAPWERDVFRKTTSAVMTQSGQPQVTFWVFDNWSLPMTYQARLSKLEEQVMEFNSWWVANSEAPCFIQPLSQTVILSQQELFHYEEIQLTQGYEGIILRHPHTFYKQNRATPASGELLKLKRFIDSEALLTSMDELLHNNNYPTMDERNYTKRSSASAGLSPAGVMGALGLELPSVGGKPSVTFKLGTGFTLSQRKWFWKNRKTLLNGKTWVKFKHLPHGAYEAPRHGVFLALRDENDMEPLGEAIQSNGA